MLAIQARGVVKVFRRGLGVGGTRALCGVDLQVPCGQAFGLIGLNGAGKTTFVKTLLGVVHPTSGKLEVLGGAPQDPAVRARVGYLPERLTLPASWTALGYLGSVGRLKGIDGGRAEAKRQLERVGLKPKPLQKIGTYSKGMRQRLGLAAALMGSPDLLVLDEPSDGVDPLGRAEIRKLLDAERDRGAAILLNSHLLSETERMCDRIAILYGGKIARSGTIAELCGTEGAYRARFARADAARLREHGFFEDKRGGYRLSAANEVELNEKLSAAMSAGALLTELKPDLRPLEEVLAEVIAE